MKLRQTCPMMHTNPSGDNEHILSNTSKKQLLEKLHSEQQEVKGITQPLLETEARFIKDLDHYLTQRDALELTKRKLLHKRWTQSVWLPVQRSIQQHFTQHGYNETQKMMSMHAHYIDHCNAKGFVFLDTYDPLEYNPFLHHFTTSHYHKISTPPLEDPLFFQSRARIKETTTILRCQTGHMYRRQQVEELLRSSPVSQHSRKQSQVSARLWEDRRLRSRATSHSASTKQAGAARWHEQNRN